MHQLAEFGQPADWQAHHLEEDRNRQRLGDGRDEIAVALVDHRIDQPVGQRADFLDLVHRRARTEGLLQRGAVSGVIGRVHRDRRRLGEARHARGHHRHRRLQPFGRHESAGKAIGIARCFVDFGIAHDDPAPAVARRPEHRRRFAQDLAHALVRIGEQAGIEAHVEIVNRLARNMRGHRDGGGELGQIFGRGVHR